jgi:chromosome segregation ATPase
MVFGFGNKAVLEDQIRELEGKVRELESKGKLLTDQIALLSKAIASKNTTINTLKDENNQLKGINAKESDHSAASKKQIEILESEAKVKDDELKVLQEEITNYKNTSISGKQMEILEKNLKDKLNVISDYKVEKDTLITQNASYIEEISHLKDILRTNGILLDNLDKKRYIYKISIDDFFPVKKFKEINDKLKELNILFAQDIQIDIFETHLNILKNYKEAKKKYTDFIENKMSWDIYTILKKGDKISKVFAKKKKFVTYANDNYLEFMDDLADFDFDNDLFHAGLLRSLVLEVKEISKDYFDNSTV